MDIRVGVIESDAPRIATLDYFTEETAEVVEYDDIGNPTKLEVKVLTNTGETVNTEQGYEVEIKDTLTQFMQTLVTTRINRMKSPSSVATAKETG